MDMQVNSHLIRSEREKRAWSQSHLASVSSLGLRTVQRIEATGLASLESAAAIAAALSLTVATLRAGDAVDMAPTDPEPRPVPRQGMTPTPAVAPEWLIARAGGIALSVSLVVLAFLAYSNAPQSVAQAERSREPQTLEPVYGAVVARAYGPDWTGPVGATGVWGGPVTAEELQSSLPKFGGRFETEPVDADWAPRMEATIFFAVSATVDDPGLVKEVQCRATVCRAVVDYGKTLRLLDRASRRQHFERASALLVDSFKPLISEPDGRLDRWVAAVQSSMEGDVATYVLAGPAYSTADTVQL
jgi:hypothetical protein